MIGAIEILIIAVIFGIIYGRDAIDTSYKKHPDEGVIESFAEDVKEYYETDPKRLVKMVVFLVSVFGFPVHVIDGVRIKPGWMKPPSTKCLWTRLSSILTRFPPRIMPNF